MIATILDNVQADYLIRNVTVDDCNQHNQSTIGWLMMGGRIQMRLSCWLHCYDWHVQWYWNVALYGRMMTWFTKRIPCKIKNYDAVTSLTKRWQVVKTEPPQGAYTGQRMVSGRCRYTSEWELVARWLSRFGEWSADQDGRYSKEKYTRLHLFIICNATANNPSMPTTDRTPIIQTIYISEFDFRGIAEQVN